MTVVGYTKSAFIIRNSWGHWWADKGYCDYPFTEWGSHWEIWTTIDEKSTKPPSPSPSPSPSQILSTLCSCFRRESDLKS